jgi:hypothetical protein
MMSPFFVPLAVFAIAAILVAIFAVVRIQDVENWSQHQLHAQEMEHEQKMRELDLKLERIKQGR